MSPSLNLKTVLTGHRAAVYALAPASESRQIYSAGSDALIVAWDIDQPHTGQVIAQAETGVFCLAFLPKSNMLVAGNQYGGLHWIDLNENKAVKNVLQHKKGVYKLIAYDDNTLFSLGGDGCLTRWDITRMQAIETLKLSHKSLRSIMLHTTIDGNDYLLIGASDSCIYVVNPLNMTWVKTLKNVHDPSVFAMCGMNNLIASAGRDAQIKTWPAQLFEPADVQLEIETVPVSITPAHRYTINDLIYIAQEDLLISASRDRTLRIWEASSMDLKKVIDAFRGGHSGSINNSV